jgi:hypothetical protein
MASAIGVIVAAAVALAQYFTPKNEIRCKPGPNPLDFKKRAGMVTKHQV